MKLLSMLGLATVTTVQRDGLSAALGDTIYNSDTGEIQSYNGSSWSSTGLLKINDGMRAYVRGALPINSVLVFNKIATPTTYEIGISKSQFHCLVEPTDTVVLDIVRSIAPYSADTTIGTLTWVAGAATPTIVFTSQINLSVGDIIKIITPTDAFGMRDIYLDMVGWTLMPIYD